MSRSAYAPRREASIGRSFLRGAAIASEVVADYARIFAIVGSYVAGWCTALFGAAVIGDHILGTTGTAEPSLRTGILMVAVPAACETVVLARKMVRMGRDDLRGL